VTFEISHFSSSILKPCRLWVCRFVTFERDSSVEQVFQVGTMHELSGKRVEVKSATPRGSGPVAGRGSLAEQRMWGPRPMGGRGMGSFPGQMSPQGFGMGGYGAVGWAFC
jgi:heterogeneous nuclear ribonucleoprotein A1/A3